METKCRADLRKGDCLELMKDLADGSIDLVVTDPPYGVDFRSNRRKDKYGYIANDDSLDFLPFLMKELDRVMNKDAHVYMFTHFKHVDKFMAEFKRHFNLRNVLVWNKKHFGTGWDYRFQYELVLFGDKLNGKRRIKSRSCGNVLDCAGTRNRLLPTQKPVDLLRIFIQNSSDEGETVLDPFMGSGSTGVACRLLDRKFIGFEIDGEYFSTAEQRIAEASALSGAQEEA